MHLDLLPTRHGGAAENMAIDFLLLQRYPDAGTPRFRHYGWHRPSFTFGYSQKFAFVQTQLPAGERFDLCRRPTGGGVVDHRDDWTYSLVIPRGHPLEDMRATQSYREVHEALAAALRRQAVEAVTKAVRDDDDGAAAPAGVCFQRAEVFDVIHAVTGAKIAGAAQKRNKRGLLFQGSLWRPAVGKPIDWDRFQEDFVADLGRCLGAEPRPVPWPELAEEEVIGLTEQYTSAEWNEDR